MNNKINFNQPLIKTNTEKMSPINKPTIHNYTKNSIMIA
jgi:hypothetical protein